MARTKKLLSTGARLSDHLSASLLARVYPSQTVEAILNEQGRNSQRIRTMPAVAGSYFCMALSLYPEYAYEQVFGTVTQGLSWMYGKPSAAGLPTQMPTMAKSAISKMRTKLGYQPLAALVERCCIPLADPQRHPDAFYAGLRLVAMDGSNFELPDEAENIQAFGYPGSRTGHAGYPQAQCAVLVECATHAILGANIGTYRASEWSVCQGLLTRLSKGMLCLADRGFNGYNHWQAASATGSDLLWRCQANRKLPVVQALDDGSYLSVIYPSAVVSQKQRKASTLGITVRVIDYTLPALESSGVPGGAKEPASQPSRYRLLSTLLDDTLAPALELAALYHERWEVEAVFDELKTHLVKSRRVLRSKSPDLVRQEFYGWVLAHYAVRWLMHQAASEHRIKQRDLSFIASLHLLRQSQPPSGAFPPFKATPARAVVPAVAQHAGKMQVRA